jgi:hypothetical protein
MVLGFVGSIGLFNACEGWLSFIAELQKRYDPIPYTSGLRSLGIGTAVFLFVCLWLFVGIGEAIERQRRTNEAEGAKG